MEHLQRLEELRREGRLQWSSSARAWVARPEDVVGALAGDGFAEYKREVTRHRRDTDPPGGVWEGLDMRTGSVASATWLRGADGGLPLVVIEIDGQPLRGEE